MSEAETQQHMQLDVGDSLVEHDTRDGPVASRIDGVTVGADTRTVETEVSILRNAIETDMRDSYPSVHFWSDGDRVAITDHEKPFSDATPDHLDSFSEPVVRADVLEMPDDAQRTLVSRDALLAALDEFDGAEQVEVLIEEDWPVVFRSGETATAVAPKLNQPVQQETGGAV